jgi:hypothetical protein
VLETVGQVLVVIERNGDAVLLEHRNTLLDELVPRIQNLTLVVPLVVSMFANYEYGIDRELAPAAAQRLRDRRIHLKVEFLRARRALVTVRLLIDVERHDFHVRLVPRTISRVADQKSVADMLRVRKVAVDRGDNCNSFHE